MQRNGEAVEIGIEFLNCPQRVSMALDSIDGYLAEHDLSKEEELRSQKEKKNQDRQAWKENFSNSQRGKSRAGRGQP